MAAALQGAVIVKQDGTRVSYKQKCEKCGNVSNSTTTTSVSSSSSSKMTSSFRCSKCGNQQKVEIQGG
jgi:DNA-directed RNA polymerase subunit M/transcription elongation factor TFIIS